MMDWADDRPSSDRLPPTDGDPLDLLIVGPHPPALRGLRDLLGEGLARTVNGLRIAAKTVGIGLVAAATATTKRLLELRPKCVMHIGTCGVYPGKLHYQPHDIIVAQRIHLTDLTTLRGRAAFPDPMQIELHAHRTLSAALANSQGRVFSADVASPLSATMDDSLAGCAATETGCDAENLEAFAVGQACALMGAPFGSVLGVTHIVGSAGQKDWKRFERDSSLAAGALVAQWITSAAPGQNGLPQPEPGRHEK